MTMTEANLHIPYDRDLDDKMEARKAFFSAWNQRRESNTSYPWGGRMRDAKRAYLMARKALTTKRHMAAIDGICWD